MCQRAVALFFCITSPAILAQTNNVAEGTAFGTDYAALRTASSISSVVDGEGALTIQYAGTTNLTVSHDVEGYLIVRNETDGFTLQADGGTVTGSQYAVLTAVNMTNFAVSGGTFAGDSEQEIITLPPIPGQPAQTNYSSSAAMGGIFYQVENGTISNATFSGSAYSPNDNNSTGTDGLFLTESSVTIAGGTYTGGDAEDAISGSSTGGHALNLTNSTVRISGASFTGGSAGIAVTSSGGAAINAVGSVVEIASGTFKGGRGSAALSARNSDITVDAGSFEGGAFGSTGLYYGLASIVDAGATNSIVLNGGSFNAIDFAGEGIQMITVGTNLTVSEYMVFDGGTAMIDNGSDTPFQTTYVRNGTVRFANDLQLNDGALFSISGPTLAGFQDLGVNNGGTLYLDEGKAVVNGDLRLSEGGLIYITVSTNAGAGITAQTMTIEYGGTMEVDATQAGFSTGTTGIVLAATSAGIYLVDGGGITNTATATNLEQNVQIDAYATGRTSYSGLQVDDQLIFLFTTGTLADYWNADGQLGELANELDAIGNTEMMALIDQINSPSLSAAAINETYFSTFNSFEAALQGLRAATGQTGSRGTEFREQLKLIPAGAKGPERSNSMRGWGRYYGQYASYDAQGVNPEYDTVINGGLVGIDASAGNLLFGVSGGGGFYQSMRDNSAEEDVRSAQGILFGTYGFEKAYLDAGVATSFNNVETRTARPFELKGSYDAWAASAYLNGGYDLIDTKGGTVFTPEAGLQYTHYEQDAYTETGTAAVPRRFRDFDADSIQGTVGMNLSMLNMTALKTFGYKLDGRLHWLHEFNPDPSDLSFMLEGGSTAYRITYPALEEDLIRCGIGCSLFNTERQKPKNVMLRVDFDELFSEGYNSHNLSAKLIYAF